MRSCFRPTLIQKLSPSPDRREECRPIGNHSSIRRRPSQPYPLVLERLSVRRCAFFFLCWLARRATANLLVESSGRAAATLAGLLSGAAFSWSTLSMQEFSLIRKINIAVEPCSWRDQVPPFYTDSTTLAAARRSMRNCSALKECPQVLHLQLALALGGFPAPALCRLFSLGRNANTNSPPQSLHSRLTILTLVPQCGLTCRIPSHRRLRSPGTAKLATAPITNSDRWRPESCCS